MSSKWISRIIYLFLAYAVIKGVGTWSFILFGGLAMIPALTWALQGGLLYLLYRSAKKRGLLGEVSAPRKVQEELNAKRARRDGYKTQYLAMVAEQVQLELAESQRKQASDVVEFVEVLKRPGKFSAVEKYRVGFVVEGAAEANEYPLGSPEDQVDATLTPQKRTIDDIIFFNENQVRIEGFLKKITETSIQYFGKADRKDSGYEMRYADGVVLTLQVRAQGFDEEVYILCPKPAVRTAPGAAAGYKPVNQSMANLDLEIGQTVRVTGDLFKRVRVSPQKWPAGFYLLADSTAATPAAASLAK